MCILGFVGEVLVKFGVKFMNIVLGEFYILLECGIIDVLEWVGLVFDLCMGFYKIVFYYYIVWYELGFEM